MLPRVAALCLLALTLAPRVGVTQSWRRPLDRFLDSPPLDRHLWGIAIGDARGRLLYGRNADRLFIPASNTKLAVAAAAAVLLPPDWTVRTSLYATGPVKDGVLQGHLVLYGRGDATMSRRCFDVDTTRAGACTTDPFTALRSLVTALRSAGVRTVTGDLVGDGSWFEPETIHPTWETGDVPWWYAAPVSGLGFMDNTVEVVTAPVALGGPATISYWPDLGDLVVENLTRTGPADSARTFTVAREPGRLVVRGSIPVGSPPRTERVAVLDPNLYAATALHSLLREAGIAVLGRVRSTTDSLLYRSVRAEPALAEVASRPVREWIVPILSTSQNWYAEMLLKQLGRASGGAGSWRQGLQVVRRFLIDSVAVDSTQFSLSDGSGLSTINLVTPLSFVRLLTWMRAHPRYPVFAAGLPVAGRSGTLRTRMAGTPLEGRVVAKTGTLSAGNTLSGYLERPKGGILIFSIQANHHALGGGRMVAAIDSILAILGR